MKYFLLTFLLTVNIHAAGKPATAPAAKAKSSATAAKATETKAEAATGEVVVFAASEGKTEFLAVGKPSMIKINGEAKGPKGQLAATKNSLSGTVKVDLNNLTTRIDLRDDHMKNKYLEVSKYPEATLEFVNLQLPSDFSALGDKETEVPFNAKFTLHGKTSDVTGTAKVARIAKHIAGNAEFIFKITNHLDTLPSWLGVKVAEDVTVKVQLKGLVQ